MSVVSLGARVVGDGLPCFVIAEAGVNHGGSVSIAHRLIEVAAETGADAVKFQTFDADALVAPSAPKAAYQDACGVPGESQRSMLARLQLPSDAWPELRASAQRCGLVFLSSPFDDDSVDFLDQLGVDAFKIPSGELTNLPFLERTAAFGRAMLVSTGMATLGEVDAAVSTIRGTGNTSIVLLHCTSSYPAHPEQANLRAMATMQRAFRVPVGYSDHTDGSAIACAAVALGACVVEKHFTLDRYAPGPDHRASLEPLELKALVRSIRAVESALGDGRKVPQPSEEETAAVARRSLVAARHIDRSAVLTADLITAKRPGSGLPPSAKPFVIGRRLEKALEPGDLILPEDLA